MPAARPPLVRAALFVLLSVACSPVLVHAQTGAARGTATRLARADSAWDAGDRATARREYAAIVAANPNQSRAVYRLAVLSGDRTRALALFRRYVALEPQDPWGYIAVGNVLARLHRPDEALAQYERAHRLAPGERDVHVGRARVLHRAERTGQAIAQYRAWLAAHPRDAEAWEELGHELMRAGRPRGAAGAYRRAAALAPGSGAARRLPYARAAQAPAVEPYGGGSTDSDGNDVLRFGLAADLMPVDGARIGVAASRLHVRDGSASGTIDQLAFRWSLRPGATVRIDGSVGLERLAPPDTAPAPALPRPPPFQPAPAGVERWITPAGQLRIRWRAPADGPAVELRARGGALGVTPILLRNRVTRSEARARLDLPVGPVRLRADGRGGMIEATGERNYRGLVMGGLAVPVARGVELSGQYHLLGYRDSTSVGYSAPRLAQVVDAGLYVEIEAGRSYVSFDVGAGAQRIARHGEPVGEWRRAFRLYSYAVLVMAPGRELTLEVEAYDTPLADAATSGVWRYGSATLGLRLALR